MSTPVVTLVVEPGGYRFPDFLRVGLPLQLLTLVMTLLMGAIGFWDDYLKVVRHESRGLIARQKFFWQMVAGLALGLLLLFQPLSPDDVTHRLVPFLKTVHLAFIPFVFPLFVALVLAGSANAVNLADGLDGLAAGMSANAALAFAVFAYVMGRVDTSFYLGLPYLPGAGELTVFTVAVAGSAIGFLWFNAPPAMVFMGDTGSLAVPAAACHVRSARSITAVWSSARIAKSLRLATRILIATRL